MKFRALAEPTFIDVEADDAEEAQNFAYAKYVRDLSPNDIQVWPANEKPEWRNES